MRPSWRLMVLLPMTAILGWLDAPAQAERPPIRLFTMADGLPNDDVVEIRRDSQGFVWLATSDGVARFDGTEFVSYGRKHGLPVATANDILEARDGHIWIATNGGGVAQLNSLVAKDGGLFTVARVGPDRASNRVNVLLEDDAGRLWAGTDSGLYQSPAAERARFELVALEVPGVPDRLIAIFAMSLGSRNDVWLATSHGVIQVLAGGGTVRYADPPTAAPPITAILHDRNGLLWMGGANGLLVAREPSGAVPTDTMIAWRPTCSRSTSGVPLPVEPGTLCHYGESDGLPPAEIRALHRAEDGRLLIGGHDGQVWELDGRRMRTIIEAADSRSPLHSITTDAEGNVWVGARPGAMRIARLGLVSFDQRDGVAPLAKAFVEDRDGVLYALSRGSRINRWDGRRFTSSRPPLPAEVRPASWSNQSDVRDAQGHWWVGTGQGLYRYRSIATPGGPLSFELVARYVTRDGLPGDDILALSEDSRGDIWIAAVSAQGDELARWNRRVGAFERFGVGDGVPQFGMPIDFEEDHAGAMWVGLRGGGVLRYRANRFENFGAEDGLSSPVQTLFVDHVGRLWVGTLDGVLRIDRPDEDRLRTRRYSSANGLASDAVRGLAEDRQGRLYVATSRGVSRLDPETDAFEHFTAADGLPSANVLAIYADRHGEVWLATPEGLSRMTPVADSPAVPPTIRIASVRMAGVSYPVSPFGAERIGDLQLAPSENHVEVDFFGLSRGSRGALRYQYRLEGSTTAWSEPSEQRTVNFASLSSGSYRFLVRAVSAAGIPSLQPAEMSFTVLPPIYLRWWFILAVSALVTLATVALYRLRVAQLVRMERVRGRIATDLHDDIGASLSQIAILAEVARQRAGAERADPDVAHPLSRIAETSRGLVDSMSDIVWAINPAADSLSDLIHRMRRFAEDTLTANDIELEFRAEEPRIDVKLGADLRREVFLVLKESVTNIAKHAGCTRVEIDFARTRRTLRLRVHDNGQGFDLSRRTDGNGLRSMRQRATAMGGQLDVMSASAGTTVVLEVDLARSGRSDHADDRAH